MKLPFFSPSSIPHEVNGTEYRFYPTRTVLVGKLRGFLKPIFKSIAVLTAESATDTSRNQTETKGTEGEYQLTTTLGALDPALAKMRAEQREGAIEALVDNLMHESSLRSLAMLILDSLRDLQETKPTAAEIDEFVENTTLPTLTQLLVGVIKANKEVFGPLGKRVEKAIATLMSRINEDDDEASTLKEPSKESQETTTTPSGPTLSVP